MTLARTSAVSCPVCRANNDAGPTCRRCRADLTLVFAIERQRARAVALARHAAVAGRYEEAIVQARRARALRGGVDIERILAALNTQIDQFDTAWRHFQAQIQPSADTQRDQFGVSVASAAR